MRLEMENESLARELVTLSFIAYLIDKKYLKHFDYLCFVFQVTSKIEMRKDYDKLEDEKDHLEKELVTNVCKNIFFLLFFYLFFYQDGTKALLVETLDEKKVNF